MKKNIIKGVVAAVTFLIAVIIVSIVMNHGNTDMLTDMGRPTLPVIHLTSQNNRINPLYGNISRLDGATQKSSMVILDESRQIPIQIDCYDKEIKEISFEVRSLDFTRLVEDTKITDLEREADVTRANIVVKDLIDQDTEYQLVIKVQLENMQEIYYHTRFIQSNEYYLDEMVSFALDFHNKTFNKDEAQDITMYLESNSEGDNTTFNKVNIHSSFSQITWGDLNVRQVREPEITVIDITPQIGVVKLSYLLLEEVGKKKSYYMVEEYYRMRYGSERIYLLDYEREMEVIFIPEDSVIANNKIEIGITNPEMDFVECEGGGIFAFTQGNRLFSYSVADNKLALLFGFYDAEINDMRALHNEHKIDILTIDETGNVRFMVYGYMNRGTYEGRTGIGVYYYNSLVNTIEQEIFIPYDKPFETLDYYMEKLAYANNANYLYLILEGTLYSINLNEKSYQVVVDGLSKDSFKISESNRMVVWQKGDDDNRCKELVVYNFNTRKQSSIVGENGEYLKPLGFMNEDIIYGIARGSDLAEDGYGNVLFPMYCVKIQSGTGENLKKYEQENVYVVGVGIEDNQINLSRVSRSVEHSVNEMNIEDENTDNQQDELQNEDDQLERVGEEAEEGVNDNQIEADEIDQILYSSSDYVAISDDQIINTDEGKSGNNVLEVVTTKEYEKVVQIAIKSTVKKSTLKNLTPKMVMYEGGREIVLTHEEDLEVYYVYGPYGLENIYDEENHAVDLADQIYGMVFDKNGNYIYRRGNIRTKNQIMKIEATKADEEKNSLAVCLDTMLLAEGITKNTSLLLNEHKNVNEILTEYLVDATVLDLNGCSLSSVLYYVDQDIPVLASLGGNEAVLIIGFNELNTVLMDPSTGTIYKKGMNDSKKMFADNGKRFVTFVRN